MIIFTQKLFTYILEQQTILPIFFFDLLNNFIQKKSYRREVPSYDLKIATFWKLYVQLNYSLSIFLFSRWGNKTLQCGKLIIPENT